MSREEVDRYLAGVGEPGRATLEQLRRLIREVLPEAEEGIAYGAPAFRVGKKVAAGFAAFKNHLSYLPHSGSVISQLPKETAGYQSSEGALRFPPDQPLPESLVRKLIAVRLKEIEASQRDRA